LEYGLVFTSNAFSLNSKGSIKATFDYSVEPTTSGLLISDNTLTMTATGNGNVTILETANDAADETELAEKDTFIYWSGGVKYEQDYSHADYEYPVADVHVYSQINLSWNGTTSPGPSLTQFTQTFSQVPEPGTLVLLGMGGLTALAYVWRRRRS
jgi:hypothetical protein